MMPRRVPLRLVAAKAIGDEGGLCAVGGIKLAQDVPDMHLHGALLHVQSASNYFVWLSFAHEIDHGEFPKRQL